MNVFHRFTQKSLKRNKSRTLVTIIGIVLSMAMFTAVMESAYSLLQYLRRVEVDTVGGFHGLYIELPEEEAEIVRKTDGIQKTAVWQEVGWASVDNQNPNKPYLHLMAAGKDSAELVSIRLLSGRMPENDRELLLPEHFLQNSKTGWKIGDTLTLSPGKRVNPDGTVPKQESEFTEGETLLPGAERVYTVVGTYKRPDHLVESYGCPGYTALTGGGGEGSCTLFFTVKKPSSFFSLTKEIPVSSNARSHSDLLAYSGSFRNGNITQTFTGFLVILILLIAFGSISLIYNSFSISVSERTKQFGILKSVGATRKQIRGTVLYEALLLCAIGIPIGMLAGCLGIGVTLYCLRSSFAGILGTADTHTTVHLVLTPAGLALAALICLITTVISAWIPARRAIRTSPILSIRQTNDIRLSAKAVRTSRLTQKLFGFSGTMAAKNFKRNRKRYRSTIFSLFLSITLFISASSFCTYLNDSVSSVNAEEDQVDLSYYTVGEEGTRPDADAVLKLLAEAGGTTRAAYYNSRNADLFFPNGVFQEEYLAHNSPLAEKGEVEGSAVYKDSQSAITVFLDDEAFRQYCKNSGLDPDRYFNAEDPRALFYNINNLYSNGKWAHFEVLKSSALPLTCFELIPKEFEGYNLHHLETEDGASLYCYAPQEEAEGEETQYLRIPEEEATEKIEYTIDAVLKTQPFPLSAMSPMLIYPYSLCDAVGGKGAYQETFCFTSDQYDQSYLQMREALAANGYDTSRLHNRAESFENQRRVVRVINVFAYGFITLISLISAANIFNTISTNVALRRQEFAMLRSVGLTDGGLKRMASYECIIYGTKGLLYGLPAAFGMTYLIWRTANGTVEQSFYLPWQSVAIAVGSVFLVVFTTMLYAMHRVHRDNPIDALKNENL